MARTDGPRAAGARRSGRQGVIWPLAIRDAYRMDRRKVDDIETHGAHIREHLRCVSEGTMFAFLAEGTGEALVPRPKAGPLALDIHCEHARVGGNRAFVLVTA